MKIFIILSIALLAGVASEAVQNDLEVISQYERSGRYVEALLIAREAEGRDRSLISRLEGEVLYVGASRRLFDEFLKPRAQLLKLLNLLGMKEDQAGDLEKINSWAQENLLRRGERWEEQDPKFEQLKPEIEPLLQELGFIDAIEPSFDRYEGALVHGALLSRVRSRLSFLVEQWKRGVRFHSIYFLSGERALESSRESRERLVSDQGSPLPIRADWVVPEELPRTEYEMVKWVWEQSELPEEMRQLSVHFINAPKIWDGKQWSRPNSNTTAEAWLKSSPPLGRYLAVSNAPYLVRQDLAMRWVDTERYGFDTIGASVSAQEKVSIILDEVARVIFQVKNSSQSF
jgi:hypothetical protein